MMPARLLWGTCVIPWISVVLLCLLAQGEVLGWEGRGWALARVPSSPKGSLSHWPSERHPGLG